MTTTDDNRQHCPHQSQSHEDTNTTTFATLASPTQQQTQQEDNRTMATSEVTSKDNNHNREEVQDTTLCLCRRGPSGNKCYLTENRAPESGLKALVAAVASPPLSAIRWISICFSLFFRSVIFKSLISSSLQPLNSSSTLSGSKWSFFTSLP